MGKMEEIEHSHPERYGEERLQFKSYEGDFKVQLDVAKERFAITGHANIVYGNAQSIPPPLQGQSANGKVTLAFDATAGFVFMKEKGSVHTKMGLFDYDVCARVHFPQGLLPPGQAIMAQIDNGKQQLAAHLNQMPHTDGTVDGHSVAVYSPPAHEPIPPQFVAIMHDATPVGYGLTKPSGAWKDAAIKFNNWKHGAGAIADEQCVEMSAVELFQNHHARSTLWAFDQVMDLLNKHESLKPMLAFVPVEPSKIFQSAAKHERLALSTHNENAKVEISSASWATMAMAAVGGAVGASLVLVLSNTRASLRTPELLG